MEILREQRPESTVHKTGDKNLVIGSFSFAFHESARESSCRIEFFFVVHLERHEISAFLDFFSACHSGEEHCASHLDDSRTVCLLGKFTGLDLDYPTIG